MNDENMMTDSMAGAEVGLLVNLAFSLPQSSKLRNLYWCCIILC